MAWTWDIYLYFICACFVHVCMRIRCDTLYAMCRVLPMLRFVSLFREPMSPNFQLSRNVTENPSTKQTCIGSLFRCLVWCCLFKWTWNSFWRDKHFLELEATVHSLNHGYSLIYSHYNRISISLYYRTSYVYSVSSFGSIQFHWKGTLKHCCNNLVIFFNATETFSMHQKVLLKICCYVIQMRHSNLMLNDVTLLMLNGLKQNRMIWSIYHVKRQFH